MGLFSHFLNHAPASLACPGIIGPLIGRPQLQACTRPYSTASSTRPITNTTKPAAVAAAKDRSTLSMMPPRSRRATFPPWLHRDAESRLRLCLEWCDRVTKLGRVRGQSGAQRDVALSAPSSGACKPTLLVLRRPVDQHRASIPSRRPRSTPSGVFCFTGRACAPARIACQAVVSSAR